MKNKAVKNVAIILACSVVGKLMSYIWEAILAAKLGASLQADALYMMLSVFNIIYPILDIGIWKVFLPIYKTKMVKESEAEAGKFANYAETLFIIASMILVGFFVLAAYPIVSIIAPGFSPEQKALTVEYMRYSSPMYLLMASASVIGAVLQCHDKFFGSQIREIATHTTKIIVFLICFRYLGIYAALLAFVMGSVFRLLLQLPFIDWEWKFRLQLDLKDKSIKQMLAGIPSVAVTSAIAHINSLVDKMVASGAVAGAVSCLNYGNKLLHVFSGLISTAIGTALYPTMVQHIAEQNMDRLKRTVDQALRVSAFLIIPLNVYCLFFSTDLVFAAFQRGAFDEAATLLTSGVFTGYSVGMLFIGLTGIVSNVFYAFGDTRITMNISILDIALNVVFDIVFFRFYGVTGLAVATSVAAIICFVVRMVKLRKFVRLDIMADVKEALLMAALAVAANLLALYVSGLVPVNRYLGLVLSAGIVAVIYLAGAAVLRIETMGIAIRMIMKKLRRKTRK